MKAVQSGLNGAFRGQFPVKYDDLVMAVHPEYCPPGDSPEELAKGLQRLMDELEARLDAAEAASGQS
jgi:hypothetical protein